MKTDPKKARFVEASRLLGEGVSKAEVARRLGVSRDTVAAWVTSGKVGDHLIPAPRRPGRPRKADTLKLPPLLIRDAEIKQEVKKLTSEDGAFARTAAGKNEEWWIKLSKHLDHIIEHTPPEQQDPKALKDWIDTLNRLQAQVESYHAAAKPALSGEELTQMQQLQQRREAMAKLYRQAE